MIDMSQYSSVRKSIMSSGQKSNQFNYTLSQKTSEEGDVSFTLTMNVSEMDSLDYHY
jgi:hypothetical protein